MKCSTSSQPKDFSVLSSCNIGFQALYSKSIFKSELYFSSLHIRLDSIFQALYHALPLNYITITKLQSKLEGEANLTTVRKLIDKMTLDGYVEATSNRRLGEMKP